MWCVENCLKFINKHAYIIIVSDGQVGFCTASARSFFMIVRNIRMIAALTAVQEIVIVIVKAVVIITTGFLTYLVMDATIGDDVNSLVGPVLFTMILAYFVVDMFTDVFALAIDAMMHCFLMDKEANEDNPCCSNTKSFPHLAPLTEFVKKHEVGEAAEKEEVE